MRSNLWPRLIPAVVVATIIAASCGSDGDSVTVDAAAPTETSDASGTTDEGPSAAVRAEKDTRTEVDP